MNFFKKIGVMLGLVNVESADPAKVLDYEKAPLDLKIGSLVSMTSSLKMILAGSTKVQCPDDMRVFAKGLIDIGGDQNLHRIYLENDEFWIQANTSGYGENNIESLVLFNYLSCEVVNTQGELDRIAGPDSKMGLLQYTHDGLTYDRVWGTEEEGFTDYVKLIEKVRNKEESYEVQHLSMLYSRATDLSDRREFLLFSVEETGGENGEEKAIHVTLSLGVNLSSTDFNVL